IGQPGPNAAAPPRPAADFTCTAPELFQEFRANSVAAEDKYRSKVIIVSGLVLDVGTNIQGHTYLALDVGGFVERVQCFVQQQQRVRVAALQRSQAVTVKGQFDSYKVVAVLLSNCTLEN